MSNPTAPDGEGLLICIPTYNEAENLARIVPAALEALPKAHVLVIDDASPDGTGDLADGLAANHPQIHVLHRAQKEGLGRAYVAGFHWALQRDYRFVMQFDADFSHRPEHLPAIFDGLREADLVIGSRRVAGGGIENWSLPRRALSWGGSFYARTVLGVSIQDLTGGFNAYRREVLEAVGLDDLETTGYAFQVELKYRAVQAGFRALELPIIFPDRVAGYSKMGPGIIKEAMTTVIRLRLGRGPGR